MERYRGKSVSPNIAIGRIWFYEKEKCQIEKRAISDSAAEWKRYEDASVSSGISMPFRLARERTIS